MIRQANLREDSNVLDIAAGTGEPGLTAAALVPRGHVTLTDLAEHMLTVATKTHSPRAGKCRDSDLRRQRAAFRRRELRRGTVPLRLYVLPRCLRRRARVRAGGKAGGTDLRRGLGEPPKNPWATTIMGTIARHVTMPAPPPGSPGLFRCATQDFMRAVFAESGLRDISEEEVSADMDHDTPERYWEFMNDIAAPVVAGLAKADEPTRERIGSRSSTWRAGRLRNGVVRMRSTARVIVGTGSVTQVDVAIDSLLRRPMAWSTDRGK